MTIRTYLEEQNPKQSFTPRTQEQEITDMQAHLEGKVQIEFWNDEFTFQNGADAPITGEVKSFSHRAKLTVRAMELARDEGKKYIQKSGMDTLRMDSVTTADIENTKNELRRYGAEI